MTKKIKASLFLLSASFFFSLMGAFIVLSGNLPVFEKSLFRNLLAVIFTFILLLKQKPKLHLSLKAWSILLLRSFFGSIAMFANFYALDNLLLADATMIGRLSPFFIILFSYLFLKEKITKFHLIFILIAFIGSTFIIKPQLDFTYLFPYLVAIIGAIAAGVALTMIRRAGQLGIDGSFVIFFFSAFSTIINIPLAHHYYIPISLTQFFFLLCTGLCAFAAQYSLTKAYFNAPARDISILDYSQLIFAGLFGYVLFSQIPDHHSLIGYAITILAGIGLFLYNKKNDL